jgi:hypothetical protein
VEDAEGSDLHDEWRRGRGTWDKVGRYMRFQPGLSRMAQDYAREMFGVGWDEEVPPVSVLSATNQVHWKGDKRSIVVEGMELMDQYMAIHMRRGGT